MPRRIKLVISFLHRRAADQILVRMLPVLRRDAVKLHCHKDMLIAAYQAI